MVAVVCWLVEYGLFWMWLVTSDHRRVCILVHSQPFFFTLPIKQIYSFFNCVLRVKGHNYNGKSWEIIFLGRLTLQSEKTGIWIWMFSFQCIYPRDRCDKQNHETLFHWVAEGTAEPPVKKNRTHQAEIFTPSGYICYEFSLGFSVLKYCMCLCSRKVERQTEFETRQWTCFCTPTLGYRYALL